MRPMTRMNINECRSPCKLQNYEFSPLISNKANSDQEIHSYIYLNLITNDTIVEEEVRIFDVNSIIGTVGGALGLFVGFSFFTYTIAIFDVFQKFYFKLV